MLAALDNCIWAEDSSCHEVLFQCATLISSRWWEVWLWACFKKRDPELEEIGRDPSPRLYFVILEMKGQCKESKSDDNEMVDIDYQLEMREGSPEGWRK